jgi:hypothetical protein
MEGCNNAAYKSCFDEIIDPTDDETILWQGCERNLCKDHMELVTVEANGEFDVTAQYCKQGACRERRD